MEYNFNPKQFLQQEKILLVKTNGEVEEIEPHRIKLKEAYEKIGCRVIEFVRLSNNRIMIVDEEGALSEYRKLNFIASAVASDDLKGEVYLFGNVIITSSVNVE